MLFKTMFPCALFGDIGGSELLVVLAAILLLFGGKRLPSIARQIGRMMEDLRNAAQDFKNQLMNADRDTNDPADPDGAGKPTEPSKEEPRSP